METPHFDDPVERAGGSPERMEQLYRTALKDDHADRFRDAVLSSYQENPDDILLTAWYHRLRDAESEVGHASPLIRYGWRPVIGVGVVTGLVFWAISGPSLMVLGYQPYLALLWAPVSALSLVGFGLVLRKLDLRRSGIAIASLAAVCAYAILIPRALEEAVQQPYIDLAAVHLPLLAYAAVGVALVGWREDPRDRFAYLGKSLEVFVTAGLFGISGVILAAITAGMFEAIGVQFPEWLIRLAPSLGAGLIPVLAVATAYDPALRPGHQDFSQGLSRFIAMLMRILLPLASGVLLVHIFFIPFRFMEPFVNRDVLIVYNVMLFAVMALLVGAAPVSMNNLSHRASVNLRRGIVVLAGLAVLVGVYALTAVVYRTAGGGITVNRLTVIGWNAVNISILILLIVRQARAGEAAWLSAVHSTFSTGAYGYVAWGLFVLVVIPILFA